MKKIMDCNPTVCKEKLLTVYPSRRKNYWETKSTL